MNKFFKTGRKAALEAGKVLMKHYGKARIQKTKASSSDIVTQADYASEKKITKIISDAFPEHSIIAEESGYNEKDSDYAWVIDPLDGTNNFFHALPTFAVSIGLLKKGKPFMGFVNAPCLNEFFHAVKGKGTFLNGKKIRVSQNKNLKELFVATGFVYNRGSRKFNLNMQNFKNFYSKTYGVRRMGAAAIDLAYIAAGRFDVYFEFDLKPWDLAAGMLLVTEAGGRISNEKNKEFDLFKDEFILASNNKMHSHLLKMIKT